VTRSVSKPNRKLVTFSADGARNWSTPVFHPELWEPICMASIVAYPSQPSTLLFSCPQSTAPDDSGKKAAPAGKGKRENLTIKLSHDDGRTWPVNRTLEPGASAYSDLAVLPDGSLVCFYEGRDQLVAARFSMEWLKSGETEANP
jgi:sialidase-1